MKTIEQRLTECNNIGPGFDLLRITLAFGVLAWHTVTIVQGNPATAKASFVWPFAFAILPMFFALSGFLVTASALRLPLREYILNRSFRIVPALAVDIFFAALILGPIVSTFTLGTYVQDPEFRRYFLNIIGWIHYRLPGVFIDNPNSGVVNGALWAVPYEIGCYVIMSLMISMGLLRNWVISFALVIAIMVTAVVLYLANFHSSVGFVNQFIGFAFFSKGASLIPCFLAGSVIYLGKSFIPWDWRIAAAILAGLVALSLFGPPSWFSSPAFSAAMVFPLSYLVVWLGLADLPKLPVFDRGDYSYGIYLYHYPILQLLQMLFGFKLWWTLLLSGFLPVVLFAMFSWHSIEKPVLKQRRRFSLTGARIVAEEAKGH